MKNLAKKKFYSIIEIDYGFKTLAIYMILELW